MTQGSTKSSSKERLERSNGFNIILSVSAGSESDGDNKTKRPDVNLSSMQVD